MLLWLCVVCGPLMNKEKKSKCLLDFREFIAQEQENNIEY